MATIRKPKTALKFNKPSAWWGSLWREGIPTGNGIIGASVFGGAGSETVMLNHADLWWQGYTGVLQDVADKLKDVRKALDENEYYKAADILPNALISKGYRSTPAVPLPLLDLKVKTPLEKPVKEYSRVLNMDNGEISVSFKDGATKYERSLFVSRAHDLLVYEFTKTGTKLINVEFSLDLHDRTNIRTPQAVSKVPEGFDARNEKYFMYMAARADNGTDFGAVAKITHYGGSMEVTPQGIKVKDAERITLILKPFVESQREKEWKSLKTLLSANKLTYDKLLKEHTTAHAKLFGSAEFDLEAEDRDSYVEDLIRRAVNDGSVSDALLEKLWAYGRFLLVCSTSDTSRPCSPYGLWCGDYKAVMSAVNVRELPLVYGSAFSGGLAALTKPIFNFYEQYKDDLKKNAARLYGCRGIFVPEVAAPQSALLGTVDSKVIHFLGGAGIIAGLYYDYYLYTGDLKFLKDKAMPFMKEAVLFYEEFLRINVDHKYDCYPSYSPENSPSNLNNGGMDLNIARNSTFDFAVLKTLLNNLISGCERTGMYKDDLAKWQHMLSNIPEYNINAEGIVKEYVEARHYDNHESRSVSHLYPVFPGTEKLDEELGKAFLATAKRRLTGGITKHNVVSFGNLANIFARLGDKEGALESVENIVRTSVMNNLVTARNDWRDMGIGDNDFWAPYQITGNLGITSAISEMVVGSKEGSIYVMPAVPDDWKKGEVSGLATRCGVEVDVAWGKKRGVITLKLKAAKNTVVNVQMPVGTKRVKGQTKYNAESRFLSDLSLQSGKPLVLELIV